MVTGIDYDQSILRDENSILVQEVAAFLESPKTETKIPCGIIVSGKDQEGILIEVLSN